MRFQNILLAAAITGTLASCQTLTPQERRAADERSCAGYGFRPGTDAMARCLLDLDLDRRADARAWQAEVNRPYWGPVIVERRVITHR